MRGGSMVAGIEGNGSCPYICDAQGERICCYSVVEDGIGPDKTYVQRDILLPGLIDNAQIAYSVASERGRIILVRHLSVAQFRACTPGTSRTIKLYMLELEVHDMICIDELALCAQEVEGDRSVR